jgi:hypothetical protein
LPPCVCHPLDSMGTTITYDEVAALCANPPTIAPHLNFINLCNLWRHTQRALQHLRCPQSNIFGWAGLIMARPMYALLTTSLFQLPTDSGPLAIYYLPPTRMARTIGTTTPLRHLVVKPSLMKHRWCKGRGHCKVQMHGIWVPLKTITNATYITFPKHAHIVFWGQQSSFHNIAKSQI